MADTDICVENVRTFTLMLLALLVDVAIPVYLSVDLISTASASAPSVLLPHLFIWYGLWQPGYTFLTLLAMYSFFMTTVVAQRLARQA